MKWKGEGANKRA